MRVFLSGLVLGVLISFAVQVQALPGYGYEIDRIISLLEKIETNTRKP